MPFTVMRPDSTVNPSAESPPRCINDVPEELLMYILGCVKENGSPKDFWNCLKTSRAWHRIGLGVHGRLDLAVSTIVESGIRCFEVNEEGSKTWLPLVTNFSTGGLSPMFISQLRSFTVHVLHARIESPLVRSPGQDLFDSIGEVFCVTQKLTTFSFKFASEGWDLPHGDVPAVPQSALAKLVESLPETVVNLEIDTAGVEIPPCEHIMRTEKSKHLCTQISNILHRLRHLRLRVSHVCEGMLFAGHALRPCPCEDICECCNGDGESLCERVRSWVLGSLGVWVPQGTDDRCRRALKLLAKLPSTHGTHINIISQQNLLPASEQPATGFFRPSFVWRSDSNIESPGGQTNLIYGHTLQALESVQRDDPSLRYCEEHRLMATNARRMFEMGEDAFPKSPYPYMAEWTLEGSSRWAQNGKGGCRYPALEGEEDKPFWKASHSTTSHDPTRQRRGKTTTGLWACLFPDCRTRCKSLQHLRGHQIYAHPSEPHCGPWLGLRPCPSVGCSRIGHQGFSRHEELQRHILTHHLYPCTSLSRAV